ncbi:MAG: hypothetical protein IT470_08195 [Pseudomonadales bacterium]|nr:hypothetical protein [Pseudomonadales bacterium]
MHALLETKLPVWLIAGIAIAALTVISILLSALVYGNINALHCALSLFLSINLLICYWEMCLFFCRDYIEERHVYWKNFRDETGRTPAVVFLTQSIALKNVFNNQIWADVWATYSLYDGSYADRRTFGFNADIGNGFATLLPTIIFHLGITVPLLPPMWLGILGIMIFWVWIYNTSLYWVSFFVVGRHKLISRTENLIYIAGTNAPWVLFSIVGLYVSIRITLDNSLAIIGH